MCLATIAKRLEPLKQFAETKLPPFVLLAARLLVAKDFFFSGKLKLDYILNDDADTLYFLFQDYNVPLLPVKVAAWMGMMGELGFSTLLALGLFGRIGALGLVFMSGMVYMTDQNSMAPLWAMLCIIIAIHGPGKFSIDTYLFCDKKKSKMSALRRFLGRLIPGIGER